MILWRHVHPMNQPYWITGLLQLEEGMKLGLHIITYACGWDVCCSRNTQISSMLPTLFEWQEGQLCPYLWETGSEQKWPIILDSLQTGSVLEHSFQARCTFTVLPCLAFASYLHNPGGSARHENFGSSQAVSKNASSPLAPAASSGGEGEAAILMTTTVLGSWDSRRAI